MNFFEPLLTPITHSNFSRLRRCSLSAFVELRIRCRPCLALPPPAVLGLVLTSGLQRWLLLPRKELCDPPADHDSPLAGVYYLR
jgi:hypothetical protein